MSNSKWTLVISSYLVVKSLVSRFSTRRWPPTSALTVVISSTTGKVPGAVTCGPVAAAALSASPPAQALAASNTHSDNVKNP